MMSFGSAMSHNWVVAHVFLCPWRFPSAVQFLNPPLLDVELGLVRPAVQGQCRDGCAGLGLLLVVCSLPRRKEAQAGCVEFALRAVLAAPGRRTR